MRYLGGKNKIAKYLAVELNRYDAGVTYVEPFMGSCWVTCEVEYKKRIAGDLHDEVVELYHKIAQGWVPPRSVSREEFEDIRDNRATGKYPRELVAFVGFGCAFAASYWRGYAGEIFANQCCNSLLRKKEKLRGVHYFSSDYRDLNPKGCVVYCDPPYAGASYGFRITGRRGNGHFDNDEFWRVMEEWARDNVVFVSEYNCPLSWDVVWERDVKSNTRRTRHTRVAEHRTERLFRAGDPSCLVTNQPDDIALGVPSDWFGFKS